ncbi:MAG: 30S ribosomal protein S27ae [archaeon]|nr:30S ribosomal protein S27ae [archaeon]
MARKKRSVSKGDKKKRVHRPNKGPMWEVKDGKVVRTHRECPRCGSGVYMAQHYSRVSCGRCGYTKFNAPKTTGKTATSVGGVKTTTRRRKKLQK